MKTHQFTTTARFADLDTQRHVTSRTFESFCMESRFELLFQEGHFEGADLNLQTLIDNKILLQPQINFVKFYKEQQPGAELRITTEAYSMQDGCIYWYHEVLSKKDEVACVIALKTQSMIRGKTNQPVQLLEDEPIDDAFFHGLVKVKKYNINLQTPIKQFNNSCKQTPGTFQFLYSDRTPFFDYPMTAIWRVFEEGRWQFGEAMGFTQERILELDTITFFTGATIQIHAIPEAGKLLQVLAWVEKIEKIRLFLRQDLVDPEDGRVYMSMREEQLIVSLAKRRPKKADPAFLNILADFIEQ